MIDPQSVVPESVMPKYAFMMNNVIDGQYIADKLSTNAMVGVPYTEAMIENAIADFAAQADPNADTVGLQERYGAAAFGHLDVNVSNFDGQPELTEMDAIIAYLQVLGTMVDFTTFIPDPTR
jgi:cytochrome c oxidase cbb3-type subunit 2